MLVCYFKKSVDMFEHMEISWYIYEGVVEPSYKKPTWADANRSGCIRHKRGEAASSWTRPEKGESASKRRKRHVYSPTGKSKTCLIHGPGHSSEECEVLGDRFLIFLSGYLHDFSALPRALTPLRESP